MDRWQYAIVLGACLLVTAPLEAFGAKVYRRPRLVLRTVVPTAVLFVLWDALAVAAGVWTYDPRYLTGPRVPPPLPVEEVLFFVVIPLCALLTYGCVESLVQRRRNRASSVTEST